MENEIEIIPQSVLDEKKQLEDAMKDGSIGGVYFLRRRQTGMSLLHRLMYETEDAEIIEIKQIENKKP